MPTDDRELRLLTGRVGVAASVLWSLGAVLAGVTGALSLAHSQPGYAAVYASVAAGLTGLAIATWRGARPAQVLSFVLLGSQLIGAVGAGWELSDPDDTSAKARHLGDLGVNFRLALLGNLLYSAAASATFLWAMRDLRRRRARRR